MKLPALADCKPGFYPVEYNVLIAPADAEDKTPGGIILPDAKKETDRMATMRGLLVEVSPHAFNFENVWPKAKRKPEPGDQVVFAKYAGTIVTGKDGREYRAAKDKDIIAVYQENEHG